jgi:hypothetical protein
VLVVGASFDLGEFVLGAGEADLQSFDLAEPALAFGFGDAGGEVVADLGESVALGGVVAADRPIACRTVDDPRGRRVWRTVLTLSAIVAGTVVVPGVAQAAPPEGAAIVREAAVFANLDSLSPPVVTTLEPGRDVATPRAAAMRPTWSSSGGRRPGPSRARRTSAGPTSMPWTCTPRAALLIRRTPAERRPTDEDSGGTSAAGSAVAPLARSRIGRR